MDGSAAQLSGGAQLDLTGACWHVHLEHLLHLLHLVVILEHVEFGSLVNTETLTGEDWWL